MWIWAYYLGLSQLEADLAEKSWACFKLQFLSRTSACNRLDVFMNRTSSVPKSVLPYCWIRFNTSVWKLVLTQSCFPNKETYGRCRVKQFLFDVPTLSSFLRPMFTVTATLIFVDKGSLIWYYIWFSSVKSQK